MIRAVYRFARDVFARMGDAFYADNTVRHLEWPSYIKEKE